jgi:hypothetical protein
MTWNRQTGETEEWYERFSLYLYMGPERTIAAAHAFATRLAKGAAHGQLNSWRRAAQRYQWKERAAAFDAELCRKALASDERLQMIAELLHQVYSVLRRADLLSLSREEARQLLPTFRLFFRDLLQFHHAEAANLLAAGGKGKGGAGIELSADDFIRFMSEVDGLQTLVAELKRVSEAMDNEDSWRPLRDALVKLYPDEAGARRIAAQAHLDSARIHFSARAVDGWHAILTEAVHTGQVERIIAVAEEEYRTNRELVEAVRHYRQSTWQERSHEWVREKKRGSRKKV